MRNTSLLAVATCRFLFFLLVISDISLCLSHSREAVSVPAVPNRRKLRGDVDTDINTDNDITDYSSQYLHISANVPYEDRFSACFACYISLSSSTENKNLYDQSSFAAMMSAIHLIMDEPEDTIVYDRDPERVCAFTDGVERPIVQGVINFSITKTLIQPTYTWQFQELVDSLTAKAQSVVTDGTFATILLQEIETHDATLLQYGQFERVLSRLTAAHVTVAGEHVMLPRPTLAPSFSPSLQPTLAPTLNASNIDHSYQPDRDADYYARRTAPLFCIGFLILVAMFVLCCVEPRSAQGEKARAVQRSEENVIELAKPIVQQVPEEETDRVLPSVCYAASPEVINRAFIYIKPHAAGVQLLPSFIRDYFEAKKQFRIVGEGHLSAKWAHDGFEKQYHKMYKISCLMTAREHLLSMTEKEVFSTKFSLSWDSVLSDALVKNVPETCSALCVDQTQLCDIWMQCIEKGQMVKLNDSFYCGFIDFVPDMEPLFCINGFFMSMRAEYILYTTPMPYFLVEWSCDNSSNSNGNGSGSGGSSGLGGGGDDRRRNDSPDNQTRGGGGGGGDSSDEVLTWKSFNKQIIGTANPLTAHSTSLRASINAHWEALRLPAPLDMKDNAIHASSSAFAALADRTHWLAAPTFSDPLGYALNMLGVTPSLLSEWLQNPIIKGQHINDHFKNLGCKQSIDVAYKLLIWNTAVKNGVSQEETGKAFHDDNIPARNCAFMYIKPHANTFTSQTFVREFLQKQNFIITLEGDFDAEYMSEGACIDKQYAAMAEKSLTSPSKLDLSEDILKDFEGQFGVSWESVVTSEQVLGVAEAAEFLELSDTALSAVWVDIVMKTPAKMIKLERSVYCCLVDCIPEKQPFFCINGFFMGMRAEYNVAPSSVHYFLVEWSSDLMDWKAFRTQVIGACNPYEAASDSLRRCIATQWLDLHLQHPLDLMNNAIHASSSAFEACIERSIWFKTPVEKDAMFAQKLLAAGIPLQTLKEWAFNPQLFDRGIFDHMLDLDSAQCIAKARVLVQRSSPDPEVALLQPQDQQDLAPSPFSSSERRLSSSAPASRSTPRQGTPHPAASGITTVASKSRRRTTIVRKHSASSSASAAVLPLALLGRRQLGAQISPIEEGESGDQQSQSSPHHQQKHQQKHQDAVSPHRHPPTNTHTSRSGQKTALKHKHEDQDSEWITHHTHGEEIKEGDAQEDQGDKDVTLLHPQQHPQPQHATPHSHLHAHRHSRPAHLSPLVTSAARHLQPQPNSSHGSKRKKSVML